MKQATGLSQASRVPGSSWLRSTPRGAADQLESSTCWQRSVGNPPERSALTALEIVYAFLPLYLTVAFEVGDRLGEAGTLKSLASAFLNYGNAAEALDQIGNARCVADRVHTAGREMSGLCQNTLGMWGLTLPGDSFPDPRGGHKTKPKQLVLNLWLTRPPRPALLNPACNCWVAWACKRLGRVLLAV